MTIIENLGKYKLQPLVSIGILAYNHEKYIAQCLDGVLMQKTSFTFQIVISEDCSTDSTVSIIKEYQKKFPDKINTIFNVRNIGLMPNFIQTLKYCKGKYIALCDGDDYWIDPFKLQKQVNILETFPEFSLCIHDCKVIYDGVPAINPFSIKWTKNTFTFNDILHNHFIPSLSLFFRKSSLFPLPYWFVDCISGDIALELILLSKGDGYYLHEIMGVKRKNKGGITFNQQRKKNKISNFYMMYKRINNFTNGKYSRILNKILSDFEYILGVKYLKSNFIIGLYFIIKSIFHKPNQIRTPFNLNKKKFLMNRYS